jgi:hypothetical protein
MVSDWNKWAFNCPHCTFGCTGEKLMAQHMELKHPKPELVKEGEKK